MTRRKRFDSTARVSAVAVFEDELKARSDAYVTHLVHGGKADCGEEFYLDALYMAIAALLEQEERRKGCEYCNATYIQHGSSVKFCYRCGRRLEEV